MPYFLAMQPLNAIISCGESDLSSLKHASLLFDAFYVAEFEAYKLGMGSAADRQLMSVMNAEIDYLLECGIALEAPEIQLTRQNLMTFQNEAWCYSDAGSSTLELWRYSESPEERIEIEKATTAYFRNSKVKQALVILNLTSGASAVPVFLPQPAHQLIPSPAKTMDVYSIALEYLPIPGEMCSWEQIREVRADLHDKEWGFRRFLRTLSDSTRSEGEIRDDIEWTLNEYTRSVEIHRMKTTTGLVEDFVIPTVEVLENLAKLNWAKLAKGILSVRKKKIEDLEFQAKAPGRECAFLFDVRQSLQRKQVGG